MTALVAPGAFGTLTDATAAAAPREACGLLFGARPDAADAPWLVTHVSVIEARRDAFTIPPPLLLSHAADPGWIGVWHSHPEGPDHLSPADVRAAAAWPRLLHLLVTPLGVRAFAPAVRGLTPLPWRIADGGRATPRVLRSAAP